MKLLSYIIDKIYPPACYLCSEDIFEQTGICHNCFKDINFISSGCKVCGVPLSYLNYEESCYFCLSNPPVYDEARAILVYDDLSHQLIHDLKYKDKTYLAPYFAKLMYSRFKNLVEKADIIIPVPIHKHKLIRRYFNQSALIAQEVSKLSGKAYYPDILIKHKVTSSQTGLDYQERQKNIKGSFSIKNSSYLIDKSVLLIDDVMTTGATISECSKILKLSGAKNVSSLVFARTCAVS